MGSGGSPEPTTSEALARLLAALKRPVPARPAPGYLFGLLLAAACVAAMPLVYLALIGCIGAGWWWIVRTHLGLGEDAWPEFLQLAVLPSGPVLILFLLKPFLARRLPSEAPVRLDAEVHPRLDAVVQACAAAMGAPAPVALEVDLAVNAAAGMRREGLVLVLGLPLVAGLDLRSFVCVLAHEFGHFDQPLARRLDLLTTRILNALARAAHGRDAWDEQLERARRTLWIFASLELLVRATRKLLDGLLRAGALARSYLARQMEFDADRRSAELCGSESVVATLERIEELARAETLAGLRSARGLELGLLPDDWTALVLAADADLRNAPDLLRLPDSSPSLFHGHPPALERMRRVRALACPERLPAGGKARDLIHDFVELSRTRTGRMFEELAPAALGFAAVSSSELVLQLPPLVAPQPSAVGLELGPEQITIFDGELLLELGEFPVPAADPEDARRALARAMEAWPLGVDERARLSARRKKLRNRLRNEELRHELLAEAGVRIELGGRPTALELESIEREFAEVERALAAQRAGRVRRLRLALALLQTEAIRSRLSEARELESRAGHAWRRAAALRSLVEETLRLGDEARRLARLEDLLAPSTVSERQLVQRLHQGLRRRAQELFDRLSRAKALPELDDLVWPEENEDLGDLAALTTLLTKACERCLDRLKAPQELLYAVAARVEALVASDATG